MKKHLIPLITKLEAAAADASWAGAMTADDAAVARRVLRQARVAVADTVNEIFDVDSLREDGYAVVIISPERLQGLDALMVADRLDRMVDGAVKIYKGEQA